ncbi:MAG: TetR/AcrR family transcriptional regulator [Gemmatimonadetes bacterium]|nr:TetR/AcrR family transcriptional regulator [Gemmatimonadota bacterium]
MADGSGTGARAPDETRRKILEAAFEEFYLRGFQSGSLEAIVSRAGVTKGALYHHFQDKAALGYAVVDEVVREPLLAAYLAPLEQCDGDPLSVLQEALRRRADDFVDTGIALGCPLNNLAQEMSPLDEGFRARVAATLEAWTDAFAAALAQARERGYVRPDVDTDRVAAFVVAAVEGSFGVAKNAASVDVLRSNLKVLSDFLDTLRPATSTDRGRTRPLP